MAVSEGRPLQYIIPIWLDLYYLWLYSIPTAYQVDTFPKRLHFSCNHLQIQAHYVPVILDINSLFHFLIYYCFSRVKIQLGKEKLTLLCASLFKVLPHDSKARRLFVTSGGLKKVQEIKAEPGSLLQEYINSINNCYPEEIVRQEKWTLGRSMLFCFSLLKLRFLYPLCENVDFEIAQKTKIYFSLNLFYPSN